MVVATYAYWKRSGLDPALLGKTIRINERRFTVVGITPQGFTGTMTVFGPELFFPLGVFDSLSNDFQGETARTLAHADAYNLFLVARMRDDISMAAASQALALLGRSLAARVSRRTRASVVVSHRSCLASARARRRATRVSSPRSASCCSA